MATQTSTFSVKIGTPLGAVLVLIALVGAFLFDTDGSALGIRLFGVDPEGLLVGLFGVVGDLVWIIGLIAAALSVGSIVNLLNDDIAKQSVILQYLVAVHRGTPTSKLYPQQPSYDKAQVVFVVLVSLFGMGSGFWFTGTAWLASVIFTQGNLKKFRYIREDLDQVMTREGLDGVRILATQDTLKAFALATAEED